MHKIEEWREMSEKERKNKQTSQFEIVMLNVTQYFNNAFIILIFFNFFVFFVFLEDNFFLSKQTQNKMKN